MLFSIFWITIPEKNHGVTSLLIGLQPNAHDSNPGKYCPVIKKGSGHICSVF